VLKFSKMDTLTWPDLSNTCKKHIYTNYVFMVYLGILKNRASKNVKQVYV